MPTSRPKTVKIAQGLLGLAALLYLAVPFLVVASSIRLFDYYGISTAETRNTLVLEFLLWLGLVTPMLIVIAIASWGMIKGSRVGRVLIVVIFSFTATILLFDVIDPSDSWRLSYFGLPLWADVSLKLLLALTFVVFDILVTHGRREKAFFARHASSRITEPPPPPTFSN